MVAPVFAALLAVADVYATGTWRWVQGAQGAASTHYGNTTDVAVGYARDGWWVGADLEGWFGHAPFGKPEGAADAYVSPGIEGGIAWRVGAWQLGPRAAFAASGWSSASDDGFGSRRDGVPPVITLGVRARYRGRWLLALDVVRAASTTPDAPPPDDRGGTSIAFGAGIVIR